MKYILFIVLFVCTACSTQRSEYSYEYEDKDLEELLCNPDKKGVCRALK